MVLKEVKKVYFGRAVPKAMLTGEFWEVLFKNITFSKHLVQKFRSKGTGQVLGSE